MPYSVDVPESSPLFGKEIGGTVDLGEEEVVEGQGGEIEGRL